MKNELTILLKLQSVIQTQLNTHLSEDIPQIGENNVLTDFPDVDLMPRNTMLYLIPNWAEYESLSTNSDNSTLNISVFILCKKDKQENLIRKIHGYFIALYTLLRKNMSLDGEVDFTDINDVDFYYAVEGNKNVQGAEISVSIRYTKDF